MYSARCVVWHNGCIRPAPWFRHPVWKEMALHVPRQQIAASGPQGDPFLLQPGVGPQQHGTGAFTVDSSSVMSHTSVMLGGFTTCVTGTLPSNWNIWETPHQNREIRCKASQTCTCLQPAQHCSLTITVACMRHTTLRLSIHNNTHSIATVDTHPRSPPHITQHHRAHDTTLHLDMPCSAVCVPYVSHNTCQPTACCTVH